MVVIPSHANTTYNSLVSEYKEPGSCLLICSNLKVSTIKNPTVALTVISVIGKMLIQIFSKHNDSLILKSMKCGLFSTTIGQLPITESTFLDSVF